MGNESHEGAGTAGAEAERLGRWRHAGRWLRRRLGYDETLVELRDFTTTWRVLPISLLAIVIGLISVGLAALLLRLIAFFTNLFYFQRISIAAVSPAQTRLGAWAIVVPVIGGLIVGVMARYGSDLIRGHGIPEAIEAILLKGSRVQPRLAVLKPVSAAIAIGSGGPFGAEGPIIMTGGAVGSLISQFLHLTSAERKTLLVAGSAAGMSATFATPVAAVLLAVELLLFEWKPRSLIPVALASATAAAGRVYVLGAGPVFATPLHPAFLTLERFLACFVCGVLAGILAALLTHSIYLAEDLFHRLPIHWMWWPAIGGLGVGIGGLLFPPALGVGYDVIGTLLQGNASGHLIAGVLLVKSTIWAMALGSGTSGGVLAPLLMMGSALGGLESTFLPDAGPGFWPLVSMGATLGGTMRSPLAGVVFAVELTHDFNLLPPLLISVLVAYGFTVLTLRRSILTEKLSRRGRHLGYEFTVDPLENVFVREVMEIEPVTLPVEALVSDVLPQIEQDARTREQRLYPVVEPQGVTVGVVTRHVLESSLLAQAATQGGGEAVLQAGVPLSSPSAVAVAVANSFRLASTYEPTSSPLPPALRLRDVMSPTPVIAFADESLRAAADRMAQTGLTRLPVVDRYNPRHVVGIVSLRSLLEARQRLVRAERLRERVLRLDRVLPVTALLPAQLRNPEVTDDADDPVDDAAGTITP